MQKEGNQLSVDAERPHQLTTSQIRCSGIDSQRIPQIEWACPPQFMVDPDWQMATCSQSRETLIQLQRESTISEAIYHCSFNIPDNPSVASDAHGFHDDENNVSIIPLDPLNDETASTVVETTSAVDETASAVDETPLITSRHDVEVGVTTTTIEPLAVLPPDRRVNRTPEVETQPLFHRDEVIGLAAELTALIETNGLANQIDPRLLIQLLNNPGMLDQLMKERGLSSTFAQPQKRPSVSMPGRITSNPVAKVKPGVATSGLPLTCRPVSVPVLKITENLAKVPVGANTWFPSVPFTKCISQEAKNVIERVKTSESQSNLAMPLAMVSFGSSPSSSKVDLGKIRKLINEYGLPLGRDMAKCENAYSPSIHGTPKDSDYYRRLVLQHGMAQERHNPQGYVKTIGTSPIEPKSQEQQPCVYFNMAKGCRRGSSCWFKHIKVNQEGSSGAVEEPQCAKRMKLSGRNFVGRMYDISH